MEAKIALVAGATGLVGGQLLSLLIGADYYSKVISVGRRKVALEDPKLEQRIVDFDQLESAKLTATDVYCCLGTTMKKAGSKEQFHNVDYTYPLNLAKAALANGAQQYFLVSAMGANESSKIFYNKVKGEVELAICKLDYKSISIFRPSLLLGNRNESRTGEGIAQFISRFLSFLLVGPLKKYKPIQAHVVAQAMFKIAQKELNGVYIFESDKIKLI